MHCRVHTEVLGPGPSPDLLVRALSGSPGLTCLWGSWADGGALILQRPLRTLAREVDPAAALADQPRLDRADPAVVGGGWFGCSATTPGAPTSRSTTTCCAHGKRRRLALRGAVERRARPRPARHRDEMSAALLATPPQPSWQVGPFDGPRPVEHLAAVERAVELIRAGELYQVNVCTRLGAGSPAARRVCSPTRPHALRPALRRVRRRRRSTPWSSLSPELFLRRRGREVVTARRSRARCRAMARGRRRRCAARRRTPPRT